MNFLYLPTEIIYKVLEKVSRKTLYQCMFLCKSLYIPVIQTYYNEIWISNKQIKFLNEMLILGKQDQQQNQNLIKYGKRANLLKIHDDNDDDDAGSKDLGACFFYPEILGEDQLSTLISYLPNLKKVDVSKCVYSCFYESVLRLVSSSSGSSSNKHMTAVEAKLNHVEEISSNCLAICFNFCKTLTYLNVKLYGDVIYSIGGQEGTVAHFLAQFKHLKNLAITDDTSREESLPLPIFEIVRGCPNLTTFKYDGKVRSNEVVLSSLLSIYSKKTNLNVLDLYLGNHLTAPYIKCIMQLITSSQRLNTVNITMKDTRFDDWIEVAGIDNVMLLAKGLSTISNVSVCCDSFLPPLPARINVARFLTLLKTLQGDRMMHCAPDGGYYSNKPVNGHGSHFIKVSNGQRMFFRSPAFCRDDIMPPPLLSQMKSYCGDAKDK